MALKFHATYLVFKRNVIDCWFDMTDRSVKTSYLNQNKEFSGEMKNVYFSLNLLCKMIRQKVIGLRFYANEQEIMHLNYLHKWIFNSLNKENTKTG